MAEFVTVTVEDQIATIRWERPKLNALNAALQAELGEAAQWVTQSSEVRAMVLYGGEKVFAAGADIKEMAELDAAAMQPVSHRLMDTFSALAEIPKPVVAAVNGYALGGGCELALCADIRIAAPTATFGQPEILLGIIPGAGGTQRLTRLVGPARAKDLVFTGRFVDAEEALRIGLVDAIEPDPYAAALAWAGRFRNGPAVALAAAKRAIDEGLNLPLADALEVERRAFAGLFDTEDQSIGMRSFVERGPGHAEFVGH